jgi:hypothetical protein
MSPQLVTGPRNVDGDSLKSETTTLSVVTDGWKREREDNESINAVAES